MPGIAKLFEVTFAKSFRFIEAYHSLWKGICPFGSKITRLGERNKKGVVVQERNRHFFSRLRLEMVIWERNERLFSRFMLEFGAVVGLLKILCKFAI
jgi:hypothetical protein